MISDIFPAVMLHKCSILAINRDQPFTMNSAGPFQDRELFCDLRVLTLHVLADLAPGRHEDLDSRERPDAPAVKDEHA